MLCGPVVPDTGFGGDPEPVSVSSQLFASLAAPAEQVGKHWAGGVGKVARLDRGGMRAGDTGGCGGELVAQPAKLRAQALTSRSSSPGIALCRIELSDKLRITGLLFQSEGVFKVTVRALGLGVLDSQVALALGLDPGLELGVGSPRTPGAPGDSRQGQHPGHGAQTPYHAAP